MTEQHDKDRAEFVAWLQSIGCWELTDELDKGGVVTQQFIAWQAARANSGWLPIESAPKDGTALLLWDSFPFIGSYFTWHREGEYEDETKYPNQWESSAEGHLNPKPTHWMPLPTPPKGDK